MIIYRGPSLFDPTQTIVAILTPHSDNRKTGDIPQVWILNEKWGPVDAIRTGRDAAVCGDCKLRRGKGGACYVVPHQAPLAVWRMFARGGYAEMSPRDAAQFVAGKTVRLGAYGDPAAVPFGVWAQLVFNVWYVGGVLSERVRWVGYTHAWRTCSPLYKTLCMASVDNVDEALEARAMGWRTFRIRKPGFAAPTPPTEIRCPASAESGHKTTCGACHFCHGANSLSADSSVVIDVHGACARRFT